MDDDQKKFSPNMNWCGPPWPAGDLAAAKKAAAVVAAMPVIHHGNGVDAPPGFVQDARKFAETKSLAELREVFKSFSKRAVHVTEGKSGYYVAHCPMVPNNEYDLVQTTKKISNPYLSADMPTCGTIKG